MSASNDNVIRIMCPNLTCKRILAVPTTARGKLVRCRGCGINLRIPAGKSAAPGAPGENAAKPGATAPQAGASSSASKAA
jgi:hypothetical protein